MSSLPPNAQNAGQQFDRRDSRPQILMCPPNYYGVEYEINPWMSRQKQPDHALAVQQWTDLRAALEKAGARTLLLPPVARLPDMVFTANAAMVYRDQAVLARFRFPQRRGEEIHDAAWLTAAGFEVHRLQVGVYFEGAGDALFCGDTLFAGYRIRSDVRGHQQIGEMFSCRVIPLELVDPYYYHLDTCFCPLAPGVAIYFPGAFDDYGRKVLAEHVPQLISGHGGRGPALRLQRRRRGPDGRHERRLPATAPGPGGAGLHASGHSARRVRQSRRQRQMPDPAS